MNPLTTEELEFVKTVLKGLLKTLEHKKGIGSQDGLLTDESIVLEALSHPERGDVEVTIFRDRDNKLEIFISNRRESDSPFSVMGYDQMKAHIERRPLDNTSEIKEDEYGLYLVSFQDRELLNDKKEPGQKMYSVNLGVTDHIESIVNKAEDLKGKALADCTPEDKVKIYIENKLGDNRVEEIRKEFFLFNLLLKKYNQSQTDEAILLEPNTYKSTLGQIIRDAYPYRIRVSLREDFKDDHIKNLNSTHAIIAHIKTQVEDRIDPANPPELEHHYGEMSNFLDSILSDDPELSRFS